MLKVDTVCMETQAQVMLAIANQLNEISSRVAAVNQKLRWETSISASVRSGLTAKSNDVSVLDERASRLAAALVSAIGQYQQHEDKAKSLVGAPIAGEGNSGGSAWSAKDDTASSQRSWLGYEATNEGDKASITGWVGKKSAQYEDEDLAAEANGYLLKGKVEGKRDLSLYETKTKYKCENGKWTGKEVTTLINAELAAGVSGSVLSGDVKVEAGDDMWGAGIKAEGSAGNIDLEGKGKFSIGDDGINAYVEGKAIVSAVKGKATGTLNVLGLEISVEADGYAGAVGAEGKCGFKDGDFVMKVGAAAVIGGSVGIQVGLNEEGWNNFVDFVTFWD